MATADDDIDALYQLPLDEFTTARNSLAKRAGADPGVKALQKPSVPAWAVNQLYWQKRKTYERLVAAAAKLRAAHAGLLTGRRADVAAAESAHRDAVKGAMDAVRGILTEAGDPATPATLTSVSETLEALPGDDPPGRLTRPLKPRGFEALTGLFGGAAAALELVPPAPRTGAASSDAAAKRDAAEKKAEEARRREVEALADELKAAKASERQATAALERARTAHRTAEQDRDELTRRLDALGDRLRALADAVHVAEREAAKLTRERERLELRVAALRATDN
jgi:hypothetical protein